ncbi:hypothetical protein E3E26_10115 [Thermococcus sp. LS1]|uniref:DsrE family protein n=1 Tax=Thermococcus sp. LS1 TaxID=1638259 RepID=UPI00143B10B4|nr:DsrE family protein [Thermococcus sp. LS1]NJE00126.1 hypothetical protein [Thermococcus sp. LS1]
MESDKLKVVFHLDLDDTPTLMLALKFINNLFKDVGQENAEVAVLANAFAVKLFVKDSNTKFKEQLENLHNWGVKFYVCNNALNTHCIDKSAIFEFCEIVPAGITKLIELQKEGYAYVKT